MVNGQKNQGHMTKGQRRLAAIVFALMGIWGTLMALEDRMYMNQQETVQTEVVTEVQTQP